MRVALEGVYQPNLLMVQVEGECVVAIDRYPGLTEQLRGLICVQMTSGVTDHYP